MASLHPAQRPLITATVWLGLAILPPSAVAQSGSLGAHVHGIASLQVAVDGSDIDLLFRSPADNLLGFEHAPRDQQQAATVAQVEGWLEQTPLVNNAPGNCQVVDTLVEHGLSQKSHDHDHGNTHDDHRHSDFEVSQRLTCTTAVGDSLTTPLKSRFPAIDQLIVDWVTDRQQGQVRLQGDNEGITLTP